MIDLDKDQVLTLIECIDSKIIQDRYFSGNHENLEELSTKLRKLDKLKYLMTEELTEIKMLEELN